MPYAFGVGITQAQAKAACQSALSAQGYTSAVAGHLNTTIGSRTTSGLYTLGTGMIAKIQSALTAQGYTAARAGEISTINIRINTSLGTVDTNVKGHVQSGLTAQGYTVAKAAFLNTAIGSRATMANVKSALTNYGYTSALATKINTDLNTALGTVDTNIRGHVQSGLTAQGLTTTRAAYLDNLLKELEDSHGSLLMTGAEQTVKAFTSLTARMDCYVDLSVLQAGDTVVMKQYMMIKSGGSYRQFGNQTYSGVQTDVLILAQLRPAKYGFKITLTQTAGTMRTIDWEVFKRVSSTN